MSDEKKWRHHSANRGTDAEGWRYRGVWLYGPNTEASAEWSLLNKSYNFGWGFRLGRNGSESHVGLDLHAGFVGNLYLRLRSPWTRWATSIDQTKPYWYEARHYGLSIKPHKGCLVRAEFGSYDGQGAKSKRDLSFRPVRMLGSNHTETITGQTGMTTVPLPEGTYPASWTQVTYVTTYTGRLGKIRDRIRGPRTHSTVDLDIPGGIPFEGKGENSWDCGMDGVFGTSGPTVADAVGNAVKAVLRNRERYGGPHNLPRPISVSDADEVGRNG